MVFNLKRSLINIFSCRLVCKNIRKSLLFALGSLITSTALYFTRFNTKIHHACLLCCILTSKLFTGSLLLTFYFLTSFFVAYLMSLTFKCIQPRVFVGLKPLNHQPQFACFLIEPFFRVFPNGTYSLLNSDNLTQPIQMKLSKKQQQKISIFFCTFLKSRSDCGYFDQKDDPHRYVFSKLQTEKDMVM